MNTREQLIERLKALHEEEAQIRKLLTEMDTAKWEVLIRMPGVSDHTHIGDYATEQEATLAVEAALNAVPTYRGNWERQGNHWFRTDNQQERSIAHVEPVDADGQSTARRWS